MTSPTGIESTATAVLSAWHNQAPKARLLAVTGIPGSGKSTVAAEVARRIAGAVVVPMDGYHLPRSVLTSDGLARRGAPDTFDPDALRTDLVQLRQVGSGAFPAFDHAVKDPQSGAIVVHASAPLVIVEGLYLLLRAWQMESLFEFSVFLDCELERALERVAERHLACGIAATPAQARYRAQTNDRRNALTILEDGCRERADLCIPSGDRSP
jgi:pantothenate kinase